MEFFDEFSFPERTLNLISPLTDIFTIKIPKISTKRTMKNIDIIKEDGIFEQENKNSQILTPEEQIIKNNYNFNLYKTEPPGTILAYSDNENNSNELVLVGKPINYEYLMNILQNDNSNIESPNEINGTFLNKNIINHTLNIKNNIIDEKRPNIIFDSKFESGNLRMAIKLNSDIPNEYDLIMRKDYNCDKNYSWFYFSIKSDKETDIKFNIINFTKKTIMFDEKNKIRILVYNSNDKWTRNTFNVQYYQNGIKINPKLVDNNNEEAKSNDDGKNEDDNNEKNDDKEPDNKNNEIIPEIEFFSTLSFCYHIDKTNINIPIYFSFCFPYSYSTLQKYLFKLSKNQSNKNKIKFSTLQKTICGNPLDILYITNFNCLSKELHSKPSIIFTARVHPGETSGSYVIESVISKLLDNSILSNLLLDKYIFKIIPMLNPDGVIHGHYRNNILGKDLNRMWQEPTPEETPTIFYLKKLISINKPYFFCDFHGHTNLANCALYCCSQQKKKKGKNFNSLNTNIKSYHNLEERVFMKIFSEEAKYYEKNGEKYKIQKSKLKSARGVIFNEFNIYYSYALETGLIVMYEKEDNKIIGNIIKTAESISNLKCSTISEYYQIGIDFVTSLSKFNNKNKFFIYLGKVRDEEEEKKMNNKNKKNIKIMKNVIKNNNKEQLKENITIKNKKENMDNKIYIKNRKMDGNYIQNTSKSLSPRRIKIFKK